MPAFWKATFDVVDAVWDTKSNESNADKGRNMSSDPEVPKTRLPLFDPS